MPHVITSFGGGKLIISGIRRIDTGGRGVSLYACREWRKTVGRTSTHNSPLLLLGFEEFRCRLVPGGDARERITERALTPLAFQI